jgi:competence protein ComEC
MGDAEASDENRLLESVLPDRLSADLLKVAHHGSSGSSTDDFLYAVSPRIAVISAGEGNTFGHPHWEVLSRLQALNAEIYRTDIHGSLIFYCDGRNIYLQP